MNKELEIIAEKYYDEGKYAGNWMSAMYDGDDIIIGTFEFSLPSWDSRPLILKLDRNLDIEWSSTLGQSEFMDDAILYNYIIKSNDDDGYILSGWGFEGIENTANNGVIAKISKEGDSIWLRHILPLSTEHNTKSSRLEKVIHNGEGYLALGAMAPRTPPDSIFNKIWLYGFDEQGRLVANDDQTENLFDSSIKVYPNPASELVYIETSFESAQVYSISLYDQRGQLVRSRESRYSNSTYVLSTYDLSAGMYVLRIGDESGRAEQVELLVAR